MKRMFFAIFEIFAFFLMVTIFEGCSERIKHLLGERIVELNVKNSHGAYTSIFLKSNDHVLTISENSNMKYIALQENCAISYNIIFLYKNTTDTLYFVWWSESSDPPQFKTDANIQFIFEPNFGPEIVQKYYSLGFEKFPKDAYR